MLRHYCCEMCECQVTYIGLLCSFLHMSVIFPVRFNSSLDHLVIIFKEILSSSETTLIMTDNILLLMLLLLCALLPGSLDAEDV